MTEENSKLKQAIIDFGVDAIGLAEIMRIADNVENKLEVTEIALELVGKYLNLRRTANEPRHYMEEDPSYWINRAQIEQTNRICREKENAKTIMDMD